MILQQQRQQTATSRNIYRKSTPVERRRKKNNRKKWTHKMTTPEFRHIGSRTGSVAVMLLFLCVTRIDYFIRSLARPSVRPTARSFNMNKRSAIF